MRKCPRYALIPIMVCLVFPATEGAHACCAAATKGVPVVNAAQTVIIWWDKANQTEHKWPGKTRYSQPLQMDPQTNLLRHLNMPESTGPSQAWLTEFEDSWPYGKAPGDVYFSPSADQGKLSRDLSAAGQSFDPTLAAVIGVFFARPLFRRRKIRHTDATPAASLGA